MNKRARTGPVVSISMLTVLLCAQTMFSIRGSAVQRVSTDTLHRTALVLEDSYGRTINTAAKKNKVIFINFWALSCPPCKAEMPSISRLHEHFKSDTDVLFLAVDLDHDFPNSNAYMKEKGLSLTVYTPASVVPQAYFHGELPTTVVLDKKGNIAFFKEGEGRYDSPEFIRFIDSLRQ